MARAILARTKTAGPSIFETAVRTPTTSKDPFRFVDPWFFAYPEWSGAGPSKQRAAGEVPTAESALAAVEKNTAIVRSKGGTPYTRALLSGVDGVYAAALAQVIKLEEEEKAERADASTRASKAFEIFGASAFGKWAADTGYKWADEIIVTLGGAAGHPEKIKAALEKATACYVSCVENSLPPPLQNLGYNDPSLEYWQSAEKLAEAGCAYQEKIMALPPESVTRIRSWWALVTKNIKNPAVRDMIVNTWWGGLGLATDAQVYMAAVPVAAELKRDPKLFARDLWNYSRGWAGAPESYRQVQDGTVSNAAALQWDTLVADAYTLGGISPDGKATAPAESGASLATVAAVGVGIGVLAWLLFL